MQAVYTALKETESRATDVVPLWKLPFLAPFIARQRKALDSVALIRRTTEELIAKCKEMVDAEEQVPTLSRCLSPPFSLSAPACMLNCFSQPVVFHLVGAVQERADIPPGIADSFRLARAP